MPKEHLLTKKLNQINRAVQDNYQKEDQIGVLSGLTGLAIFQFYYSKLYEDQTSADIGSEMLSKVIEHINDGYSLPTYCTGIAGAGWALEFLSEQDFIELDCDELLPVLDDYLVESIKIDDRENYYDFLHGVLGTGYYFFKRYQNTKSAEQRIKYRDLLSGILQRLENTGIKENDHIKWESYLIRDENLRGYNLGMAHGICSIINFLSRIAGDPYFSSQAKTLIQKATYFVLSFEQKEASTLRFPDWVTLENKIGQSGRLAWCYGDLSMGISLWRAGKVLEDQHVKERSLNVLKDTTKRINQEDTKIVDAGICHGSAGLAQMYKHLYHETKEPVFNEACQFWMDETLAMDTHEQGYAGYMQKRGDDNKPWQAELGLLEGVAGIGLSIISYLNPSETQWDQCLMIG